MSFSGFFGALAALPLLVLLTFFNLQQLHISTGTLFDWLTGVAVCWWLVAVTVLPWNTHFAARDILEEARVSREKGIEVPESALVFARKVAARFGWLADHLRILGHQIRYPREDVVELRARVTALETHVETLRAMLDFDQETSWAAVQQTRLGALAGQLGRLDGDLAAARQLNARDHEQLARQITTEIGKLSEDARFLNQVRELIRFVRTA